MPKIHLVNNLSDIQQLIFALMKQQPGIVYQAILNGLVDAIQDGIGSAAFPEDINYVHTGITVDPKSDSLFFWLAANSDGPAIKLKEWNICVITGVIIEVPIKSVAQSKEKQNVK